MSITAAKPVRSNAEERSGYLLSAAARVPISFMVIVFLSPYATHIAKQAAGADGRVTWFGVSLFPASYVSAYSTIYSIISAFMCPIIGTLADVSPHRHLMILIASVATATSLFASLFVHEQTWWIAGIIFVIALVTNDISAALANAYLPEIADTSAERSHLSTWAVAYGNVAQLLLVVLATGFLMAASPDPIHVDGGTFTALDVGHWHAHRSLDDANTSMTATACGGESPLCFSAGFGRQSVGVNVDRNTRVSVYQEKAHASLSGRTVYMDATVRASASLKSRLVLSALHQGVITATTTSEWAYIPGGTDGGDGMLLRLQTTLPLSTLTLLRFQVEFSHDQDDAAITAAIDNIDVYERANMLRSTIVACSGIWLAIIMFLTLRRLGVRRDRPNAATALSAPALICRAFVELACTVRQTASNSVLARFLLAQAFFCAGAGPSISMTATFFREQLLISQEVIGIVMLSVQMMAIIGAFTFDRLGRSIGHSRALCVSYGMFVLTLVGTFTLLRGPDDWANVFLLAPSTGMCLGASLCLSRAVLADMIPRGREAELYGLFAFAQVALGWMGTLLFLAVQETTNNSMRHGMLSECIPMLIAFVLQCSIGELEDVRGTADEDQAGESSQDTKL